MRLVLKVFVMKSIDLWLSEYGESHTNPFNKLIHWFAVPVIYLTVFGLLWEVPKPAFFTPTWLNWATVLALPAMVFYFALSKVMGVSMTLFTVFVVWIVDWYVAQQLMPVAMLSVILFVIMWILQFIGHHVEGKKPSFFKDVQFLLIGPMWLMAFILKKLNINYNK